ncbi:MAG: redoxin domain-containing protein [Planctomycetaceae bacterium]
MNHRRGILVLAAAAIVIFGLSAWRIANPRQRVIVDPTGIEDRRPAPSFKLHNQDSKLVPLDLYLDRHRVVLVFFDGTAGPEANGVLTELRDFHEALKREGVVVFGVSAELPQNIRRSLTQPMPFELLSDVKAADPDSVHRRWGCLREPSDGQPAGTIPAVFLIDRSGLVAWKGDRPLPLADTSNLVTDLLSGR